MSEPGPGHNSGRRLLELDDELLAFVEENCDSNLRLGLGMLQKIHDGEMELAKPMVDRVVWACEMSRKLKRKIEEAKK